MARRTTNDEDGRPSLTHMLQPTVLPSQWAFGANSTSAFLRVTHDGLRCRIALHYVDLHGSPLVDYHSVVVPLHSDADERADPPENLEQFGSAAIRKGILLHRYVTFVGELLNWKWGRLIQNNMTCGSVLMYRNITQFNAMFNNGQWEGCQYICKIN